VKENFDLLSQLHSIILANNIHSELWCI